MSQYIYDIVRSAGKTAGKLDVLGRADEYVIVFDTHLYPYYLVAALASTIREDEEKKINIIYENASKDDFFEDFLDKNFGDKIQRFDNLAEYKSKRVETDSLMRTRVCFFSNYRNENYKNADYVKDRAEILESYLEWASAIGNVFFTHVEHIPEIKTLPKGIFGISEREYNGLYSSYPKESPERTLLYFEDICKKYVENMKLNVMRVDTIFGPHIEDDSDVTIQKYVKEIVDNQTITVDANARNSYYSASYIKDAIIKTLVVLSRGVNGNIYHCSSFHFNLFEIVFDLYVLFDYLKIDLKIVGKPQDILEYHVLNAQKMRLITTGKIENAMNSKLRRSIHVTALSTMKDYEHYITEKINVYYGKIDRIRQLELELLLEIDKICKENNINYFLTAGAMLGAVRHKGFIPWDDDIDIGMLPEDYKKFVKVCPELLSDKYSYQTTDLEPASLYIHDKIRIKDTAFSTRYANQFQMENGVYIDIFVYYKTSNNERKQKRHIRQIHIMRRLLGLRWVNKPRKGRWYYLTKVIVPIMSLFPTTFFRHLYIRVLEKYEKKNTDYLIDGTGFNLEKVGAFPREWFGETIEWEFCGHTFPILKRYDDFLKHWFGENYMELLPFSERKSVHDVIKIDLGSRVSDETDDGNYGKLDFRGELFELRNHED